ncbi:MAG TPA: NADH:ubiquinone reductase (Na(+)-transporting) subunit B [Flavobacteriales bacterium]|jgi:Na+-transporting NADH:ubiquinone oxidoreductase subunit B|nr:NADH:ubiquinone reductase (Na(+)-transporting) subunit B [Flavobacteriales bacterium]HIO15516.1 NADH:ubiquinone reductase (Na(+)-transporting) subunit B [Flavobacteriales bacterium]HIO59923.1 NADH:ubiquinone reductase (Na(+)-transporting) subunit B [Flavobacteriales bacterium]
MKALHKLISSVKPHFEEGGKLSKFWVVFDSLETFTFTPGHVTMQGSHIRDGIDLKRTMFFVIVSLIPALLFGTWNLGDQYYASLGQEADLVAKMLIGAAKVVPLIFVSYGVGLGIEFIFAAKRGHGINEGFLVSGMLIPLIMPVDVPLWMVAVAVAFAVIIGKEVFGGTGMNIVNVALTSRAFLFFAYPKQMSGEIWIHDVAASKGANLLVDGHTGATALGHLAGTVGKVAETPAVQNVMALFADGGMFSLHNCIIGTIPGSIGETSVIAILIGAVVLITTGIGSLRIMASFLAGGLVMGFLFNLMGMNAFMAIDPLHQIVIGGFMFGMVFMATDPVTAASTNTGKYIYGFLGGLFSIMIRVFNPAYPEGVMMAILFMNVMAPLIDHYVLQSNINRRQKRLQNI